MEGLTVLAPKTLGDAVAHLRQEQQLVPQSIFTETLFAERLLPDLDFSELRGQEAARLTTLYPMRA